MHYVGAVKLDEHVEPAGYHIQFQLGAGLVFSQ
jgi:hypothetical protein